jgi:hypothetical protein
MTPEERNTYADAADAAMVHPLVQDVIDEYAGNMEHVLAPGERSVWRYGLMKCLNAATQVARAQALGIDPYALVMSAQEQTAQMERMVEMAHEAGIPVIEIQLPRDEQPS